MSETVYLLTVLYFFFVVEKVEGKCIVAFINNAFDLDLTHWHNTYIKYRDSFLDALNFKAFSIA